jgi:hypothetical protein
MVSPMGKTTTSPVKKLARSPANGRRFVEGALSDMQILWKVSFRETYLSDSGK